MKTKYQLVGGLHRTGGKTYRNGDIIESDEDLIKRHVNKFVLAHPTAPVSQPMEAQGALDDITAKMKAGALLVLKSGKLINVFEPLDKTTPLNPEPFTTQKACQEWLDDYLK